MTKDEELQEEMVKLYPVKKEGFKVRLGDSNSSVNKHSKWRASIIAGILFALISAPFMYKLTDGLVKRGFPGVELSNYEGLPTHVGLFIHAVVFVIVTRIAMM